MIGILIENNGVTIPVPVVNVGKIEWRHAEVKTVKPEAISAAACNTELMSATEPTGKAPMFPCPVHVKPVIVTAHIVSYPLIIRMNVGSIGMPGNIVKSLTFSTATLSIAPILLAAALLTLDLGRGRRTMSWNVPASHSMSGVGGLTATITLVTAPFLGKDDKRTQR